MYRSLLFVSSVALLLSGCGATIDSLEAFAPVPLEKSAFMPSKDEIKGNKIKVVLTRINDNNFELGKKANLGQSLYVELERELSTSGTVEVLDRNIAKKFEKEIRLSEMNAASQMNKIDLSAAKYAIAGNLSNAQFTSTFIQRTQWEDKEGKVHVIPAHYNYKASVSGILKIHAIPSMKIIKTIEFRDSASRSEDSRYYGDRHYPSDVSGMINQAGRSAIHATRIEFKNFLAPKGYIMEQRTDGKQTIVQVTIGSADGLKTGDDVNIYSVRRSVNPFTDEEENHDVKIATGIISDKITEHRAWIILDESSSDIKLGDYIKANYSKEFFDYLNDFANVYNGI